MAADRALDDLSREYDEHFAGRCGPGCVYEHASRRATVLAPEAMVERVNALPYPPTIYSHGWIYGLWYCGTSFQKAVYHGQYPSTFVRRVEAMLGGARTLHACSGRARIANALNVDLHALPETDLVADVESLPIAAATFEAVVIDPPYSAQDADRYKVPRLVNAGRAMKEFRRVLMPGGWLFRLDEKYPSYRRAEWALRGLIGIVTGFERRARVLSIFQSAVATLDACTICGESRSTHAENPHWGHGFEGAA